MPQSRALFIFSFFSTKFGVIFTLSMADHVDERRAEPLSYEPMQYAMRDPLHHKAARKNSVV